MQDLPRDGAATGETVVRALWLAQGYHNNAQASEQLWAQGYLHTEDLANVGDRGWLQITDRLKDVIKTGGEWVSSLELESVISQHPGVAEVAVIGFKDEKWGERPLALVVNKADHATQVSKVDIFIFARGFSERGVISKYAVPQSIWIVEAIEKTSVGKIDKKLLREKYT